MDAAAPPPAFVQRQLIVAPRLVVGSAGWLWCCDSLLNHSAMQIRQGCMGCICCPPPGASAAHPCKAWFRVRRQMQGVRPLPQLSLYFASRETRRAMRAPGAAARLPRGLTTASSLQQSRALPPGRVGPYRRLVVAPTAGSCLQRAAPGTSTPAAATTIIGRRRQPLSRISPAVTRRQTVCCADRSPTAGNSEHWLA